MSAELRGRILDELNAQPLIDPHTHINALQPASRNLADILGYHYYTELAHSAGLPRQEIEAPGLGPRELVARLMQRFDTIDNTIQFSWLLEIARELLDFPSEQVTLANWEQLYELAESKMAAEAWAGQVLERSGLEAVFLTNEFDDPLEGFDASVYIPCLRADDLVFGLARPEVRERIERSSGVAVSGPESLSQALEKLFQRFTQRGARACAISLPPDFRPQSVPSTAAATALDAVCRQGPTADRRHQQTASDYVFWQLARMCEAFGLPFDLMIGVNRGVYAEGVYQGRDLFDSRVSLLQFRDLFNAFPKVTFPISVLASVTNHELVSHAWIFPNVVTCGHWWYSNTPRYIESDLAARLEAVPRNKQIGYYSDMYKLEFALPKFNMYKRLLAKVLAECFVVDRSWSEQQAVALGCQVLRGNVDAIFG